MVGLRRRTWAVRVIFIAFLVVGVAVASPTVGGQDGADAGRIVSIHPTGDAVVTTTNGTTYVWQSEPYTANVTFQINASEDQYSVCLYDNRTGSEPQELDCQSRNIGNGSTVTVSLSGSNASKLGERTLYVSLKPTFGADVPTIDSRTINQTVIQKTGDLDDDGLTNQFEAEKIRTDGWPKDAFTDPDMDGDGLDDGVELNKWGTSPVNNDTDGDGLLDGKEVLIGTNPKKGDTDGDGIPDGKDKFPRTSTTTQPTTTTTTMPAMGNERPGSSTAVQLLLLAVISMGVLGAVFLLWRAGGRPPSESPVDDASVAPESDDEPAEILTDEGRVLQLLDNNRDRMKQADIVEETGWSKSKVSRLLSRMEERGDINRLRVGRGNIVYLEGAKPNGARSPYERDSEDSRR